ncbi:Uncharacterized conserved protein YgbK, DUF1537 family [Modicisalibacter muralis]|uniref:Uncharacterized conserved protein YgbK, DUF1537 family n=1 Tax=Modicisalibacter muralis TaxID=119000 RepID=A0A1G9M6J9_9GAMM|nr:four-carbon acid sugar kinase family protein [Halomonas muralis]SDL69846.1 Uncharacterized conserved protein YgbK, DUF1537 family [Halomonas muralis]
MRPIQPYPMLFYGDDFTGASANLLEYHRQGLRGILFVNTPTLEQVAMHAADVKVLGIAGISRSLTPTDMADEIRPVFELFRRLGGRVIQYKICATFDSSPTRGNFGTVMELARDVFGVENIPIVAAHPSFGRFTAFANHFAVYQQQAYRLDRHPSMSKHPETPMQEADLRRHLANQTSLPIGLCDVVALRTKGDEEIDAILSNANFAGTIFDAMEHRDLVTMARAVWRVSHDRSVFTLSSHGFAAGLASHLAATQTRLHKIVRNPQRPVESLVVLSGSCSPRTAIQIEHARANGWQAIRLPVDALEYESEMHVAEKVAAQVLEATARGQSIVVYAANGPEDATIAKGRGVFGAMQSESSAVIGRLYGSVLRLVFAQRTLPRLMLAGGDTSSQTVRALGIDALTIDAINPASMEAFMRMHAEQSPFDGVQLLMKAGQNGSDDYFTCARLGEGWE